jgi:hypothetical protein
LREALRNDRGDLFRTFTPTRGEATGEIGEPAQVERDERAVDREMRVLAPP